MSPGRTLVATEESQACSHCSSIGVSSRVTGRGCSSSRATDPRWSCCTDGRTARTRGGWCSTGSVGRAAAPSPSTCRASARPTAWTPTARSWASSAPSRTRSSPTWATAVLPCWPATRWAEPSDCGWRPRAATELVRRRARSPPPAWNAALVQIVERDPFVRRVLALPAPVPEAMVRNLVGRATACSPSPSPATRATRWFGLHRAPPPSGGGGRYLDTARRMLPELNRGFDLDAIRCPVLLVWGDHDRMVSHRGAEVVAAALPSTRVEILEGIGHCPQIEASERVVEAAARLPGPGGVTARPPWGPLRGSRRPAPRAGSRVRLRTLATATMIRTAPRGSRATRSGPRRAAPPPCRRRKP